MRSRLIPLSLILLMVPLAAQKSGTTTLGQPSAGIKTRTALSVKAALTAPELRQHWIATVLTTLAATTLDNWATDPAIRHEIMSSAQARFGDLWGNPMAALIILPTVGLVEILRGSGRPAIYRRLEFTATSLVTVGLATATIKELTRRQRPNGSDHRAFPSGHTSITFGVAEVVRQLYGNWAGLPLYLLAVNTGLSRIHDNKHYPSDVVAGAGLGMGIVRGFGIGYGQGAQLSLGLRPAPGGWVLAAEFRGT